jgi:hypothetical protein
MTLIRFLCLCYKLSRYPAIRSPAEKGVWGSDPIFGWALNTNLARENYS